MEFDILDSLDDLGTTVSSMTIRESRQKECLSNEDFYACLRYAGILDNDKAIKAAIEEGPKSFEFTKLVEWFSKELQTLCELESCVNALADPEDSSSFLLEVSSFLKELHCPYKSLLSGPISQRLLNVESRRILLDFLCTELQAARLLRHKKKDKNALEIEMDDSSTALSLHNAMDVLNINVDITENPISSFFELENKVKQIISTDIHLSPPALNETLSDQQSESLDSLHKDFVDDYTVRREMLLTRLDVTVQSFKWGEGSKGKGNKILDAYMSRRKCLQKRPSVKVSDVLAARESIFIVEKTSSAELVKNTKSSVNRVLIPAVPDRGGRPKEQRPPVEMPNWMKRAPQGSGRGDYHRGGWRGKKFKDNKGGGKRKGGNFDAAGSY